MGMVHHRAVDAVRREESQRRRAEAEGAVATLETEDHAEAVATELGAPQERAAIRAALNTLPEAQRAVLEMMYFDGLSQSQIAERNGLPLGTVKSRTLLGMRRLRVALEGIER
jgi:RNA polymerase sigma-70 factor (ECF subfamily)